jgi:hypothetical protein
MLLSAHSVLDPYTCLTCSDSLHHFLPLSALRSCLPGAYSAARILSSNSEQCYYFKYPEYNAFACDNSQYGADTNSKSYMQICMRRPYLLESPPCGAYNATYNFSSYGGSYGGGSTGSFGYDGGAMRVGGGGL